MRRWRSKALILSRAMIEGLFIKDRVYGVIRNLYRPGTGNDEINILCRYLQYGGRMAEMFLDNCKLQKIEGYHQSYITEGASEY